MRGEDSGAHLGLFDVRAVCVSILDGAYDWIFQRYGGLLFSDSTNMIRYQMSSNSRRHVLIDPATVWRLGSLRICRDIYAYSHIYK